MARTFPDTVQDVQSLQGELAPGEILGRHTSHGNVTNLLTSIFDE